MRNEILPADPSGAAIDGLTSAGQDSQKAVERKVGSMVDAAQERGELILLLEEALCLADNLEDAATGYLIERALDQARATMFTPAKRAK